MNKTFNNTVQRSSEQKQLKAVVVCRLNKKPSFATPSPVVSRKKDNFLVDTVCPRSVDPFYILTYYMKWVKTSCTFSIRNYIYSHLLHRKQNIYVIWGRKDHKCIDTFNRKSDGFSELI